MQRKLSIHSVLLLLVLAMGLSVLSSCQRVRAPRVADSAGAYTKGAVHDRSKAFSSVTIATRDGDFVCGNPYSASLYDEWDRIGESIARGGVCSKEYGLTGKLDAAGCIDVYAIARENHLATLFFNTKKAQRHNDRKTKADAHRVSPNGIKGHVDSSIAVSTNIASNPVAYITGKVKQTEMLHGSSDYAHHIQKLHRVRATYITHFHANLRRTAWTAVSELLAHVKLADCNVANGKADGNKFLSSGTSPPSLA